MNKLYKYSILIVVLILGYLGGNYLPLDIIKPNFAEVPLGKEAYYRLVVSIISAIITFIAIVIALFKDDIREVWKRPKIEFQIPDKITIEISDSSLDSKSGLETIKTNKYISRIEVLNQGNLPALNSEIYLDRLEFIPKDTSIPQNIECSSSPIQWNGTESHTIIIPPSGKKLVNIVEVKAPQQVSTPDSSNSNNKSQLFVGSIANGKEQTKGKWKATFSLYAQNHEPVSFNIEIEWNGVWKNRLTEFNSQFQIKKAQ